MAQLRRILLIDSRTKRREILAEALHRACAQVKSVVGELTVDCEPTQWEKSQEYDVVVIHYQSDLGYADGLDVKAQYGPQVIKFGGEGEQDESGECRSRVHAIYSAVASPPDGPGNFGQPAVWEGILLFVLGASPDKPPELSARPVDPLILATWLLVRGYALAKGFAGDQELGSLLTDASRRWSEFSPDEKKAYWRPLDGGVAALTDAKLSKASALVAEILAKVEPEEGVLAAMKEVGEFLRRKGFGQP